MEDFQLHFPATIQEACGLLDQYGDDARVIAGGTALTLLMKQRVARPQHLVSLQRIPDLKTIRRGNRGVTLRAMATHRDVETSPLVREVAPLLCDTYSRVASIKIRNMATVGGGLAHGDPHQDPPPAFIVLGGMVRLVSSRGTREVSVEELYTGYYETSLSPGEMVVEVVVPAPPPGAGYAFLKFLPRTADDYATVSVAAMVALGPNGSCGDVRIALGSVGPTPVRARRAEGALRGRMPTPQRLRDVGQMAAEEVDPEDDLRGSASYKREMAAVFTRRALEQAVARAAAPVG